MRSVHHVDRLARFVYPSRVLALLFCVLLLCSSGVAAQSAEPVDAAVRLMLDRFPGYRGLGGALLVDTAGVGFRDLTILSPAARDAAMDVAGELDARTGTLPEVMVCRDGPPPVNPFPQTCRLKDGVKAVLQVSDMKETEEGPTVWIITWTYQRDADRGTWCVEETARQVEVERSGDGHWKALGWSNVESAMW